jgi:hypothetical protein
MNPILQAAIEYATVHGTNVYETAAALGMNRNTLAGMLGNETRSGRRVKWPAKAGAAQASEVDLIRHVRNGHPYWEKRPVPMGAVGRGPSPPVPPAPSNAAERHHTAAGIAWRLDVRAGEVERLRVLLGLPVYMTDGEADAIIRIIRGAAPSQESA